MVPNKFYDLNIGYRNVLITWETYKKTYSVAQMLRQRSLTMTSCWDHLGTSKKKNSVTLIPWGLCYNWPSGRKFVSLPKGILMCNQNWKRQSKQGSSRYTHSPLMTSILFKLFRYFSLWAGWKKYCCKGSKQVGRKLTKQIASLLFFLKRKFA